jgi:hypothetical protein
MRWVSQAGSNRKAFADAGKLFTAVRLQPQRNEAFRNANLEGDFETTILVDISST